MTAPPQDHVPGRRRRHRRTGRAAVVLSVCLWPAHTLLRMQDWFPQRWDSAADWVSFALTASAVILLLRSTDHTDEIAEASERKVAALSRALVNVYQGTGRAVPGDLADLVPPGWQGLSLVRDTGEDALACHR